MYHNSPASYLRHMGRALSLYLFDNITTNKKVISSEIFVRGSRHKIFFLPGILHTDYSIVNW